MSMEFAGRVKGHYYGLSKTEKKIADYLLEHATTARHLSIQELAEDIDVSMSAISRFTKKVGYSNYQEMRLQLSEPFDHLSESFFASLDENDTAMNIAIRILLNRPYICLEEQKPADCLEWELPPSLYTVPISGFCEPP